VNFYDARFRTKYSNLKKKKYTEILADYWKNDIWALYQNDLIDNFLLGSVNLPNVNVAVKQNVVKVCYLTTSIHTLSIEFKHCNCCQICWLIFCKTWIAAFRSFWYEEVISTSVINKSFTQHKFRDFIFKFDEYGRFTFHSNLLNF